METRFLETFVLVAEHGSLAEASRRLNITAAAVAQRMQALEAEVGTPLLLRAGRRVRLTEAGAAILAQSHRILADVRQLRTLAATDALAGELRVGAVATALTGLLPPALRHISRSIPGVEIFLLPGTSTDLYQRLLKDEIDVAVLIRPPFALPKTLEWKRIRVEPLMLLCPQAWRDDDAHTLLAERPFIRYDRRNWGGRLADQYLQTAGITPREWLELDLLEAIAVMVDNELGVSIVPDWAPPWPEGLKIVGKPLPQAAPPRETGLLWPRGSPLERLIGALGAALEASSVAASPRRGAADG